MGLIDVVKKAQTLSPLDAQAPGLSGLEPSWLLSDEATTAERGNGEIVSWRGVPSVSAYVKQREEQEELLIAELKARADDSLSLPILDGLLRSYLQQVLSPNSRANPNVTEPISSGHSPAGKKRAPHTCLAELLKKASPFLGQKLLSLTLRACLVSQSFDEVRAMLGSHALSGNTYPELVTTLIELDQAALLCSWVRNVCDPRFSDLLLAVRYFLKNSLRAGKSLALVRSQWRQSACVAIQRLSNLSKAIVSIDESKENGNGQENANAVAHREKKTMKEEAISRALLLSAAVDHFQPYELCLHDLVSAGHDEAVLTSILSQLESNEVLQLLRYLKKWLEKYSQRGSLCTPHSRRKDLLVPSLGDIVQWTSVLLDAHMMSLVLCCDFHAEIRAVQLLVEGFVDVGHKLAPLVGVTEHMKTKGLLPSRTSSYGEDDHVIEYLEL
ncbi:hypothetical protein L7F22_033667 [Adiantum nelumboides]|nr:hypothetical protein [Adiantum nelumboides]